MYQQICMSFEPSNNAPQTKKRVFRQTSHEAHESVKEHKDIHYSKILDALRKVKDATSEELAPLTGLEYAQIHKRLPELISAGKVVNTGETRKNKSGRGAMVRKIVES